VRKIAERFGVNAGTVQRINRPFEATTVSPQRDVNREIAL
jgi:hypothetical protein